MTTFNQWAAASASNFPTDARIAFEAVWNALTSGGCSSSDAFYLLTDLAKSLPEAERDYDEDDYE